MNVIAAVAIFPDDVALRIDPVQDGESGSRYIHRRKSTFAQQETINVAAAVTIETHDIASRIDPKRDG